MRMGEQLRFHLVEKRRALGVVLAVCDGVHLRVDLAVVIVQILQNLLGDTPSILLVIAS